MYLRPTWSLLANPTVVVEMALAAPTARTTHRVLRVAIRAWWCGRRASVAFPLVRHSWVPHASLFWGPGAPWSMGPLDRKSNPLLLLSGRPSPPSIQYVLHQSSRGPGRQAPRSPLFQFALHVVIVTQTY
ncbi:hypothetical protein OH76DRAFT_252041 [Lentinus brumalis]|uniref:Uncharacterized protein n=1 Tax=Lentinus brumalis TaxID=2498619 RepID=A0A371CLG2_9APHY|nr:hypothetical protein OH76DRAFT_252041 [Polyporus brumalis]